MVPGCRESIEGADCRSKPFMSLTYQQEPDLPAEQFIDVLVRSTLAERRPIQDPAAIGAMLQNADLIVTARHDGLLVGVSRALTDFAFCTYLSDLAVDEKYQGRGIGKELIRLTHEAAGLGTTLILLAAPRAQTYYPHIGLSRHESCWIIPRRDPRA
jgi:ribosomal protein S18 acetylase RimI-like enzyme